MQQPNGVSQPPALVPGTLLARRYRIQGYLGGGGFGHIYLALDTALGHRRAIKEAFCADTQAQHQFRLEAEFLLNARHPNLVRGYAVFEQNGRLYLVMDYVDGQTLEDIAIGYVRRTSRALPEAQVLDWIIPVCEAAHALHTQPVPIIHRDIKPANIKLSATLGIPVLIDLGLAKLYAVGSQTFGAALAFTPGYAPPEQYQASGATDQRTDVYGLGATSFYLLTGYQPTEAPARLSAQALPAPRSLNALLSQATERAMLAAMSLDPAGRPPTAHAFAQELRQARSALAQATEPRVGVSVFPTALPSSASAPAPTVGCVRCGHANPASAFFCMRCGADARLQPLKSQSAPSGRRRDAALLYTASAAGRRDSEHRARSADGEQPARAPEILHTVLPPLAAPAGVLAYGALPVAPLAALAHSNAQPDHTAALGRVAALMRRVLARWHVAAQPASPAEAWTSIGALLALVFCSLSLTAAFAPIMVVFLAPALGLSGWSARHHQPGTPHEFRWLAYAALLLSALWLIVWVALLFGGHRHT